MAKLTILGNDKPIIGKDEMYSICAFDTMLNLSVNVLQPKKLNEKIQWAIMVQTKTGWRDGGSHKEGPYAPYKFGQPSLAHKGIKIVVKRGDDSGELIVHPQRAKEPKITKIELLDANYKPIPKGKKISYKDTIIARAHCVEMFKMQVAFTLWEDDAEGQGHNAKTNALNKINPIPSFGYVNERGIAEAFFRLPMYTMAVQIANARIASGDQNEGSTHEYYVTADVVDKKIQKASPNVNVANPTYTPPPPRTKPKTSTTRPPAKPKTAEKPKPKPDSAKFPVTTGGKSQSDRQGKILSAEFVDNSGNRVHSSRVGNKVWVKISTQNMKGKKVTVKIWEEDFKGYHDLLFAKDYQLNYDDNLIWVVLTNRMFLKGKDRLEGYSQEYFIEVIHKETSVTSQAIDVNATAAPTTVPKTRTTAEVNQPPQQKKSSTCLCQEQYKDLIWGDNVSCEFRKKVVQICSELWGESRKMEMANGLMAVMNVETWGSFKAHHREGYKSANDNPKDLTISSFHKDSGSKSSRAVGLIQFTQDALEGMSEFPRSTPATKGSQARYDSLNRLKLSYAQMGEIRQLDKVKKYFEPAKNKIKTPEDIYLHVFAPEGVGKQDGYLLYAKGTDKYDNNKSVDKNNDGIQRSEILARFNKSKKDGAGNTVSTYTCGVDQNTNDNVKATDIVTFHIYANGDIEKHIPKKIKAGFEKKYKYVFHDTAQKEHEICITDWHTTAKKLPSKSKLFSKPTHAKIVSDNNVSEGQTKRRVIYENNDIAEYGSNNGSTFWRLYKATSENIELVKMPEKVNYVKYSFSGTQRRYTGPNYFAGFIGALAITGLAITTTGSCFREGSCFPSQFHVNGESVDTIYFENLAKDQKFIDAMKFFHFRERKVGNNAYFKKLKNVVDGGDLHDSHLHCGNFDTTKIKIIKEK